MSTIITRNSANSGSVPSSLVQGELAINVTDGRLFYGSGSGNVVKEFTGSASGGTIDTGSFVTTSSFNNYTGSNTSQFAGTASYATNALTASYAVSASYEINYETSSSYADFALSASYALSSSYAVSSSYALTASYVQNAQTASYVQNAQTASYVLNAVSASYATNALSASHALRADDAATLDLYSFTVPTNSYLLFSNTIAATGVAVGGNNDLRYNSSTQTLSAVNISATTLTGSLLGTASYATTALSASFASTASYVQNAQTASYVLQAVSASFASTASYVLNAVSASFASTASYVLNAISASYYDEKDPVFVAKSASLATTGSNIFKGDQTVTGSLFTSGSNTLIGSTTLTGSLNITGSTTQIGNNTLLGNTILSGSIIISGSTTAQPTVQVYGNVTHDGYIRFNPVSTNIDTSVSASYIYVSGSTNDLYFSQNGSGYNNVTRLRWLEGNLYTGLLYGGLITTQSSTTYQISSGSGIIVSLNASLTDDPYPVIQYLQWGNLSASIAPLTASYQQAFVGIDSTGNIFAQGTPFSNGQFDALINIGGVFFQNQSTINGVKTQPSVAYGFEQQQNIFNRAFGPLKLSGYTLAPSSSSTLSLIVGSGTAYAPGSNYAIDPNEPSYTVDNGTNISKIFRYRQSGSTWVYDTNAGAGYTTIDPGQYSNNGVLTTVQPNDWSIQRVFWFPNSVIKAIVVYYGNQSYSTEADAIANISIESFVEAPNTSANAIYLGAIIIRGNGDLTVPADFTIVPGGLFRQVGGSGGGGSIITQTLAGLSDVSISGPTNGQALVYNNTSAKWQNSSTLIADLTGNASTATSASYALTASYVLNAVSSSYTTNALSASFASTASYVQNAQTASYVLQAVSASFATLAQTANTASYVVTAQTASYVLNAISASFATLAQTANTASYVVTAQTASYVLNAVSASYASSALSSSYALTASYSNTSTSASYAVNTDNAISSSYASTASYVENAQTASYVLQAVSASYAATALSSSYSTTSSYSNTSTSASHALNADNAISSSFATTASYATQALSASYAPSTPAFPYNGDAQISGSLGVTGSFGIQTYDSIIANAFVDAIQISDGGRSIYDIFGVTSVDASGRVLFDGNSFPSLDWEGRTALDSTVAPSIDWETRVLYDPTSIYSIDWVNRISVDPFGVSSTDWASRQLFNSAGDAAINWEYLSQAQAIDINSYTRKTLTLGTVVENFSNLPVYTRFNPDGEILKGVTLDGTVVNFDLVYLETDNKWYPVAQGTADCSKLLGIAWNVATGKETILIEGTMVVNDGTYSDTPVVQSINFGLPIYIRESAGNTMSTVVPTTAGQYVRILGHIYYQSTGASNYWVMKFRPSNEWIEL
jgi:hypothetical protein